MACWPSTPGSARPGPAAPPAAGYRAESLRVLFGEDAVVTASSDR